MIEIDQFDINKSQLLCNRFDDPYVKTIRECLQDKRYRRMLTGLFPIDFTDVQQLVQVKICRQAREFVDRHAKVL